MIGIADEFRIGILDTVFHQDTTTPVRTASHNLGSYCALLTSGFRFQRGKRMQMIFANRVKGMLDTDQLREGRSISLAFSHFNHSRE